MCAAGRCGPRSRRRLEENKLTCTTGSLCTGYGGLDMAVDAVFGSDLAWWSDIESGPIKVMEYHYPDTPNIGDLKAVDWTAVGHVDILTAGYPCQPFSNAGKRKGADDPRHIWPWIAYAVAVLRPRYVVLENVAAHLRRGFDVVLADLTALGYDVAWSVVRASDVGAAHRRERLFIVAADTAREHDDRAGAPRTLGRPEHSDGGGAPADPPSVGRRERRPESAGELGRPDVAERSTQTVDWQQYTPAIRRWEVVLGRLTPRPDARGPRGGLKVSPAFGEWLMGLPEGHITSVPGLSVNEQLKLVGNGVVPQQAEHAIRGLLCRLTCTEAVCSA